MRFFSFICLIFFYCVFSIGHFAHAYKLTEVNKNNQQVTITVFSDSYTKQGIAEDDLAGRLLMEAHRHITTEVKLNFMPSSMKREWHKLATEDNICLYNKKLTPEREKLGYYSQRPLLAFPPNRLITLKPNNLPKSLSIIEAIDAHSLKVGIVNGRSYGVKLDKTIASNKDKFLILDGTDSSIRLRKMLRNKRVDAFIEYWPSLVVSKDALNFSASATYKMHHLEEAQLFTFGYLVCSKSKLGQAVINLFDSVMTQARYFETVLRNHKNVMPKEEFQQIRQALISKYQ